MFNLIRLDQKICPGGLGFDRFFKICPMVLGGAVMLGID